MTTAAEQLAKYGISVAEAHAWIGARLEAPGEIFEVALQYGVTAGMLAEIMQPTFPGLTAGEVVNFFNGQGFDGSLLLGGGEQNPPPGGGGEVVPDDLIPLAHLFGLNNASGDLSTAALRNAVIAQVGRDAYNELFDPSNYAGHEDGVFTAAEFGLPGNASIPATMESLESLFYGTFINFYHAIDEQEIMEMMAFVEQNQAALEAGNEAVLEQYIQLVIGMFQDPANPPIFPDEVLATVITMGTAMVAQMAAQGEDIALFDGFLLGFLAG